MLSPTRSHNSSNLSLKAPACNLLIYSDSRERLEKLSRVVGSQKVRIVRVSSLEELRAACLTKQDMAIFDAGPETIEEALHAVRDSKSNSRTQLLVVADRIASEPGLAGVLPVWRAMPCSREQMAQLVRQRTVSGSEPIETGFRERIL